MDVKEGKEIIKKMEKGIILTKYNNPYGKVGVSKRIMEVLKWLIMMILQLGI